MFKPYLLWTHRTKFCLQRVLTALSKTDGHSSFFAQHNFYIPQDHWYWGSRNNDDIDNNNHNEYIYRPPTKTTDVRMQRDDVFTSAWMLLVTMNEVGRLFHILASTTAKYLCQCDSCPNDSEMQLYLADWSCCRLTTAVTGIHEVQTVRFESLRTWDTSALGSKCRKTLRHWCWSVQKLWH